MSKCLLTLFQCLTPLHNGAGQGVGAIDRPIVREVTTNYPFVQSSTIKGAYAAKAAGRPWAGAAFGKGETDGNQGCLLVGDARLLLFPARSMAGTMAWATSCLALGRLARLCAATDDPDGLGAACAAVVNSAAAAVERGTAVGASLPAGEAGAPLDDALTLEKQYFLESLALQPCGDAGARQAVASCARAVASLLSADPFWRGYLASRLLVLHEDDFQHVVSHATEVEANIAIASSGVTVDGSLRYTEFLPAETVLASLVVVEPPLGGRGSRQEVESGFKALAAEHGGVIQFGADESKGKGLVTARVLSLSREE
jgi:CRISPR-associated protein Cmr4